MTLHVLIMETLAWAWLISRDLDKKTDYWREDGWGTQRCLLFCCCTEMENYFIQFKYTCLEIHTIPPFPPPLEPPWLPLSFCTGSGLSEWELHNDAYALLLSSCWWDTCCSSHTYEFVHRTTQSWMFFCPKASKSQRFHMQRDTKLLKKLVRLRFV